MIAFKERAGTDDTFTQFAVNSLTAGQNYSVQLHMALVRARDFVLDGKSPTRGRLITLKNAIVETQKGSTQAEAAERNDEQSVVVASSEPQKTWYTKDNNKTRQPSARVDRLAALVCAAASRTSSGVLARAVAK